MSDHYTTDKTGIGVEDRHDDDDPDPLGPDEPMGTDEDPPVAREVSWADVDDTATDAPADVGMTDDPVAAYVDDADVGTTTDDPVAAYADADGGTPTDDPVAADVEDAEEVRDADAFKHAVDADEVDNVYEVTDAGDIAPTPGVTDVSPDGDEVPTLVPVVPVAEVAVAEMSTSEDEDPEPDASEPAEPEPARLASPAPGSGESLIQDTVGLKVRWQSVQFAFVDDPREAVQQADVFLAEVADLIVSAFGDQRAQLEGAWASGEDVSTEDLRLALHRYRAFFERLLNI